MTAGHFALAAGSKPSAKTVPLWALMVATYLMDILFMGFVSFGLESFAPMNPTHPAYGQVIIHATYTHSLAGALIIAALAGLLGARFWGRNGGLAIGLVTFSHWILDLIVHRADLPLLPGNLGHLPMLGLGLWNHPAASIALELTLAVAGSILYARGLMRLSGSESAARTRAVAAATVTAILLVLLLLTDALALPMTYGLTLMLLLVTLAGWLDGRVAPTAAAAARANVASVPAAGTSPAPAPTTRPGPGPERTPMVTLNIALRGLMELGIVLALGIWGFHSGSSLSAKLLLAVGAPFLGFGFWGAVDFRQAGRLAEALRLLQELTISALAGLALVVAGWPLWGFALLALSAVHHALVYALGQRLLEDRRHGGTTAPAATQGRSRSRAP